MPKFPLLKTKQAQIDTRPVCKEKTCSTKVNRFATYLCGGRRTKGAGCGNYFCDRHLHQVIGAVADAHYCIDCLEKI